MKILRRDGFTLIEVLIAITLLGTIMVLLFASLRAAGKSWGSGEDKIAAANQKAVVYQFFKRHLSAIRPLPMPNREDPLGVESTEQAFMGLPQSMRFVAGLPAASTRKGLQIFTIQANPANPAIIQVGLMPYRDSEADVQFAEPPVVLLEDVADFRFSYFGKAEDVDEMVWRSEWTEAERPPSLIKVSIALKDRSYWPDMIFALKINAVAAAETVDGEQADDAEPQEDQDQQ